MSTRNTILKTLKTDIKDHIKSSEDYNTDIAEIKRGIFLWEDMVNKPAIAYWCYRDEKEADELGGGCERWLNIFIYGYARTDGLGDVDEIHDLADDIETFLNSSDWTYTGDTYIGDFVIYEGGIQDKSSMFSLEIKVHYTMD